MAEEASSRVFQLYRLAYSLIFCRTLPEILETSTATLAKLMQSRNTVMWQYSPTQAGFTPVHTIFEDTGIKTKNVSLGSDYLGEVYRSGKPLFLNTDSLRQPNKHILLPKELIAISGMCVPFKGKTELQGVLEVINRTEPGATYTEEDAEFLTKALELVTVAAANMRGYEEQSRQQLNAITRLTLLYDISQIFNSTLELSQLLPIITEKIRDILDAETCTIWFVNEAGDTISCGKSTGAYGEMFRSFTSNPADDIAGTVIQQGEGILLEDASQEETLLHRFANPEETPVYTYLAAPLECKGKILGTLEVLNRLNENPYNEEDQFLLNDLSHQAAISISNANLLETERKAKELDTLLNISREITSTLNLDKVLLTIVNQGVTLIPYDRAAIALIDRNKVELRAVSGRIEVDRNVAEIKDLENIINWAAHVGTGLYISEFQGQIATDREETREKFKTYFEKSNMKSFISLPLKDDEGELGLLALESAAPYFADERHVEVASILANQATVAIRNAQLYRQVPLISIMEPLMEKKARLMRMPKSRRIAWAVGMGVVLLMLILIPWNMKISGEVTVLPLKRTPVVAEVEGIIKHVALREGAKAHKGTVIASLDERPYRVALGEQTTRRDVLFKEVSRSQSLGDPSTVRQKQIELEQALREIEFYQNRLSSTRIISPVEGILITPKIEEKIGQLLKKGEEFCEIADMRSTKAEIGVDEGDVSYLHPGQRVRLKMNSYPTRKFYGTVTLLGARLDSQNENRFYRIEAHVDNPDLLLKSGMVGKAKVEVGHRSIGYVLLRKPVRFISKKLWVWLP